MRSIGNFSFRRSGAIPGRTNSHLFELRGIPRRKKKAKGQESIFFSVGSARKMLAVWVLRQSAIVAGSRAADLEALVLDVEGPARVLVQGYLRPARRCH